MKSEVQKTLDNATNNIVFVAAFHITQKGFLFRKEIHSHLQLKFFKTPFSYKIFLTSIFLIFFMLILFLNWLDTASLGLHKRFLCCPVHLAKSSSTKCSEQIIRFLCVFHPNGLAESHFCFRASLLVEKNKMLWICGDSW